MTDIHLEGADLAASREPSAPSPLTATALLLALPVAWFWLTRDGHLTLVRPEAAAHD